MAIFGDIIKQKAAESIGAKSFAEAVEIMAMQAEETAAKKEAKDKLMATRAAKEKQPPPRATKTRKEKAEDASKRLVEIEDAKAQELRDRGVTPSRDFPDLPESGPLETDEGEQDFGDPDFGHKLVEDLVPDEVRQEQAAELMAPKAEKFFDVLGLDEPPTDVLEDHEGFEQVLLDESDEPEGEPESLAEMKSEQAAQPPKAVRVLPDRGKMESFFKTATKSSFDPNSKRDRDYMAKIKSLLEKNPGYAELSPAKFAMKLYAAS